MKDDLLKLAPVTEYAAPELPTLKEVNPEVLVRVPKRWKSKAFTAATVGLFGMTALTGCSNNPTENAVFGRVPNYSFLENRNFCWMHHGGSGGAPLYVAYLTEQEAISIIRAELERVGISFTKRESSYGIEIGDPDDWWGTNRVEVGLLNEVNNIALSVLNPGEYHIPFGRFDMEGITEQAEVAFAEAYPHLSLGLFCNPGLWLGGWSWEEGSVSDEEKEEARVDLRSNLIAQTRLFIEHLRENGVLD